MYQSQSSISVIPLIYYCVVNEPGNEGTPISKLAFCLLPLATIREIVNLAVGHNTIWDRIYRLAEFGLFTSHSVNNCLL